MSSLRLLAATCSIGLGVASSRAADASTAHAWRQHQRHSAVALQALGHATAEFGASDAAATPLEFHELFAPAGDRGLVYSDRLQALAGQRVRLSGFMVREAARSPGLFLLTRQPAATVSPDGCANTDILPIAVYVHLPDATAAVPFSPARITVTGILELGTRREASGRLSSLRLRVE